MTRRTRFCLLATLCLATLVAAAPASARTYYGAVGPGHTISLRNSAGTVVTRIPAGYHTFVVRDRATTHNFRLLRGSTVLRATSVPGTGTVTWRSLRIRAGVTYVYDCRPHAGSMRGTFRGV